MPLARSKRPLHRKPARSRLVSAVLALSLPVLVVALAAAPTASAAKGGGGKPSSGDSSGSSSVAGVALCSRSAIGSSVPGSPQATGSLPPAA